MQRRVDECDDSMARRLASLKHGAAGVERRDEDLRSIFLFVLFLDPLHFSGGQYSIIEYPNRGVSLSVQQVGSLGRHPNTCSCSCSGDTPCVPVLCIYLCRLEYEAALTTHTRTRVQMRGECGASGRYMLAGRRDAAVRRERERFVLLAAGGWWVVAGWPKARQCAMQGRKTRLPAPGLKYVCGCCMLLVVEWSCLR